MDFLTHLPRTLRGHDEVWVIVDRLTKSTHFLVVRMTFTLKAFYRLYIYIRDHPITWCNGLYRIGPGSHVHS